MSLEPTSRPAAAPADGLLLIVIASGCLIALITFGVRSSFGLYTGPVTAALGWGREVFALAIAVQNIMWGVSQPIAGALVDRFGPARVIAGGGLLYALGTALMVVSTSPTQLTLSAGLLVGLGMGGASFTTVIAGFARLVPENRRSWALGIGTAAGSLGQFLIAPLGQAFISAYGWQVSALVLAGLIALTPLLAITLRQKAGGAHKAPRREDGGTVTQALRQAFAHRSFVLLFLGFFVCGFQLAFITVHLPPYLTDRGLSPALASWAIAFIGLFNVLGAYLAGMAGGRYSKKYTLSLIYLSRSVATLLFLLLPVTPVTVLAFAAAMGLLWLSTVPPTSGLVVLMFGTRHMAMLFGMVFFSHQVGGFLGVWLGGWLFERTGSYDVVWWLSIALGLFAAAVHLPIAERRAPAAAIAAG